MKEAYVRSVNEYLEPHPLHMGYAVRSQDKQHTMKELPPGRFDPTPDYVTAKVTDPESDANDNTKDVNEAVLAEFIFDGQGVDVSSQVGLLVVLRYFINFSLMFSFLFLQVAPVTTLAGGRSPRKQSSPTRISQESGPPPAESSSDNSPPQAPPPPPSGGTGGNNGNDGNSSDEEDADAARKAKGKGKKTKKSDEEDEEDEEEEKEKETDPDYVESMDTDEPEPEAVRTEEGAVEVRVLRNTCNLISVS